MMTDAGSPPYVLEQQALFSQSLLWRLQRDYFAAKGVDAWRKGDVPDYATSNPTIAHSYAEIVLAFRRDRQRIAPSDEPLLVCELGAGSGRFAFHFLSRLTDLCQQADIPTTAFCYVLTDFTASNLDFWRQHPRFRPFFASGMLDVALFDVTQSQTLALEHSGVSITPATLGHPLIVIANYLFDSVPQELFYFDQGRCHPCVVSLSLERDPAGLDAAQVLAQIRCKVEYQLQTVTPAFDAELQAVWMHYQRTLNDTYLLFPAAGLDAVRRLKALSRGGLLLLSADKGAHDLAAAASNTPPALAQHGSFSLPVNYHAFALFCEQQDGLALSPTTPHSSISVNALLMLPDAAQYTATSRAYQRYVRDFGPDDFFALVMHIRHTILTMNVETLLAFLRLCHYDSQQFVHCLPRLLGVADQLQAQQREALCDVLEQVRALHFPLGEALELDQQIATLLYATGDYPRALRYFERSMARYGVDSSALFHMATCHRFMGQHAQADALLHTVLQHDPDNATAQQLLAASPLVNRP